MATAVAASFITVDEYLRSAFQPDMDYLDGVLEARNVGEFDHGDVQWAFLEAINAFTSTLGVRARPEIRVQVSPTRFRVPDVCVVSASWKRSQIIQEAPLLCIEVLSPADRITDAVQRSQDYLHMGVPEVWVVNVRDREVTVVGKDMTAMRNSGSLKLPGTAATLDLASIFAVLDI